MTSMKQSEELYYRILDMEPTGATGDHIVGLARIAVEQEKDVEELRSLLKTQGVIIQHMTGRIDELTKDVYRRKNESLDDSPGKGYRWLLEDEIIAMEDGDEHLSNNEWISTVRLRADRITQSMSSFRYRRPTTVKQAVPFPMSITDDEGDMAIVEITGRRVRILFTKPGIDEMLYNSKGLDRLIEILVAARKRIE